MSRDPILSDPRAVEIAEKIRPLLAGSEKRPRKDIAAGKLRKSLLVYLSLRARRFDRYGVDFIGRIRGRSS